MNQFTQAIEALKRKNVIKYDSDVSKDLGIFQIKLSLSWRRKENDSLSAYARLQIQLYPFGWIYSRMPDQTNISFVKTFAQEKNR